MALPVSLYILSSLVVSAFSMRGNVRFIWLFRKCLYYCAVTSSHSSEDQLSLTVQRSWRPPGERRLKFWNLPPQKAASGAPSGGPFNTHEELTTPPQELTHPIHGLSSVDFSNLTSIPAHSEPLPSKSGAALLKKIPEVSSRELCPRHLVRVSKVSGHFQLCSNSS